MPILFSILRIVLGRDHTQSGIIETKDMNYFLISLSVNLTSENWDLLMVCLLLFLIADEVEIMFICNFMVLIKIF